MNSLYPAIFISFLAAVLILTLTFQILAQLARRPARGWKWCLGLGVAALGIAVLPLQGLPLARWLAGYVDHWSIPLLVLLISALTQRFFGVEVLRGKDREAAWIFGAVAGVVLYPMALGLGSFDPFGLGWHFGPLFVMVGILTVILQWRQNRFGVVLLLAVIVWYLRVPESRNYWDCLMDPFYFLASLIVLSKRWWCHRSDPTKSSLVP